MIHPPPDQWRPTLRIGDAGLDVTAWRMMLVLEGYDVSGPGEDHAFTTAVHNATVAWQRAHGLKPDGIVGPATRAALGTDPSPLVTQPFDAARIPYVEARHWERDVGVVEKALIVVHCMEHPHTTTTAEWCAGFFAGPDSPEASTHYAVDCDSIVCMVPPDRIAWHAPGANKYGIGVEFAGYARNTRSQWLEETTLMMLMRAARLCAYLCERFRIPPTFVQGEMLRRGARGITTHAEVSRVWRKSTHWDPGPSFPMHDFIAWTAEALPPPSKRP